LSALILSHPAHSPTASAARQAGVLVVDDERIVRSFVALSLGAAGFAVWQAESGAEALALYQAHGEEINVVLMDVCMPEMDGAQTFEALRELNPEVRCCFMSGEPGNVSITRLLARGAVGFLPKPFSVAAVTQLIREAVQGRATSTC
jgi:CheY-like chemotaxis protein